MFAGGFQVIMKKIKCQMLNRPNRAKTKRNMEENAQKKKKRKENETGGKATQPRHRWATFGALDPRA